MQKIAIGFTKRMDSILAFLNIVSATITVAKTDHRNIKSRASFITFSKRLKSVVVANPNFSLAAYDGSYLTICAEYEMTVRNLIEKFISDAALKCTEYHHLPKEIREWYPVGCANLILNITQDKFSHLTRDQIVRSLASCQKIRGYSLIGEAFSDNHMNFWPDVVEDTFSKRIGLEKVWQKLSRQNRLQTLIGTTEPATVQRQLKDRLYRIMQRRNDIIHRGRTYFVPSETEVAGSATFLREVVISLGDIMADHLAGI